MSKDDPKEFKTLQYEGKKNKQKARNKIMKDLGQEEKSKDG